jgi:hypothetical protein
MKNTTPPRRPRPVKNFSVMTGAKVEFMGVTAEQCLTYVKKKLDKEVKMSPFDDDGCAQCLDADGTIVARIWD